MKKVIRNVLAVILASFFTVPMTACKDSKKISENTKKTEDSAKTEGSEEEIDASESETTKSERKKLTPKALKANSSRQVKEDDPYFKSELTELKLAEIPGVEFATKEFTKPSIVGDRILVNVNVTLKNESMEDALLKANYVCRFEGENDYYALQLFDLDGNNLCTIPLEQDCEYHRAELMSNGEILVTAAKYNYGECRAVPMLFVLSSSGEKLREIDLKTNAPLYAMQVYPLENGNLFVADEGYLFLFDSEGKQIKKIEDNTIGATMNHSDGKWYVAHMFPLTYEIISYQEVDINTGELKETYKPDKRITTYLAKNTECLIFTEAGVEQYSIAQNKLTPILSRANADVNFANLASGQILPDGSMIFLDVLPGKDNERAKTECYLRFENTMSIAKLTRADKNPHAGKELLKLGLFVNTDMYFINKIMDYNADPNNHAYIEVYTICEENVSFFPEKAQISFKRQSAEAVAEEMYQGTGPDLLVGFSDLYEFNNEQFLRDLKPYLDADTTIKKEDYFSNIFSSFETDEKLYSMPLTYTLKGMAVNSKVSGAKEKMTFEDLSKAAASLPAGMNLLPDYSCSDLFMQFLSVSMKDFVDYEKGEAYLDSDNFKAALEAAKSIGKADPTTAKGISVYDTNTLVKQEEQFFTGAYGAKKVSISDLENYCLLRNTKDGDKTVFTGYLSLDGKSMTASSELTMSITSCASDPDLAWEFIRYMLGTDAQQYMASNMDTLPVNKSAFDAISQEQIALSKEVHDHYLEDPEAFSSEPIAITSEQKDELSKLISSVDNTAHIDSEIQAAIFDEVDRYFNDYVTLDEFCKAIQAKASEIMKNR